MHAAELAIGPAEKRRFQEQGWLSLPAPVIDGAALREMVARYDAVYTRQGHVELQAAAPGLVQLFNAVAIEPGLLGPPGLFERCSEVRSLVSVPRLAAPWECRA